MKQRRREIVNSLEQPAGIGRRRSVLVVELLTLSALLPIGGCFGGGDEAVDPHNAPVLQALMSDGKLPPSMQGGGMMPPPPPRFCGGFGSDAGVVPPPSDAGVIGGGAGSFGGMKGGAGVGAAGFGGSAGVSGSGMGVAGTGVAGTGMVVDDAGVPSGSCESVPIGFWRFDDCNPSRTDLNDSSFQSHTAFRNVDLQCVPSQQGLGVALAATGDLVYAPDQPDFVLDQGVTVAAWVKPNRVDQPATIFRKRDDSNSAFALIINGKKFQFVVKLASGKLATVTAPAKAGVWTHVAATYDGMMLRLYENGTEVSHARAVGVLSRGVGPLLMGNDISERRLNGVMDDAWFNTLAAPADTIMQLTCLTAPPSATVTPQVGPAVVAGTDVAYQLNITNNNSASCAPDAFVSFVNLPSGFNANPQFVQSSAVASGQTTSLTIDVVSGDDADAGNYLLDFQVFAGQFSSSTSAQAQYVVVEPTGCHVSSGRELTIRDVSVVDDPLRTTLSGPSSDPRTGAWSFGRLMERLSPSAAAAPDVTETMFSSFLVPQTVNGFVIPERPAMDPVVLQPWPRTSNGKLDLTQAPLRLLAIVDRLDLVDLQSGKAGELRMVYGMLDPKGNPLQFTVILEYLLPASDAAQFKAWADAFHALQALPFPSESYNAALQALTDKVTAHGALPGAPNGSSLIDIRTNEIELSFQWQLREFHLSPTTGFLDPATLFRTPDAGFNFTDTLARFINANETSILSETHDVPPSFEQAPFQAASVFNNFDFWDAPGINDPEARHKFSLNTCNGCHGAETQTSFLQISPRSVGQSSQLSGFLTGITVSDPVTGQLRQLAELKRRRLLLEAVVCGP